MRIDHANRFNTEQDITRYHVHLNKLDVERRSILTCREHAANFLRAVTWQLMQRLPPDQYPINNLKYLSPKFLLNEDFSITNFPLLSTLSAFDQEILHAEIRSIRVRKYDASLKVDSMSPLAFWSYVYEKSCDQNNTVFEEIFTSKLVLGILSMVHSTASVERVFSYVNIIHDKVRNSMKLESLQAVLRVRLFLKNRGKCCNDLIVSEKMLSKFNVSMYSTKEDDEEMMIADHLPPEEPHN